MIINVLGIKLNTEEIAFISNIKERQSKLYWDIDDSKYVSKVDYSFKIGFITGDYLIVTDSDFDKLNNEHNKLKSKFI